nr:Calmodulin-binding protein 60 C [Ipomoea batatas]
MTYLYKKHYPPALSDEVWRLEKIGKDGSFHKRLNKSGIFTVEDFLRLVVTDSQRLRSVLGSGMSNKMWEALVEHAKTCVLSGKLYVYYPDDMRNVGVVFNNIYELCGLIASEQYHSIDSLSDNQKVYVDTLVKKAYENWMHVIEYDGKSLLSLNDNKNSDTSQHDQIVGSQNHSNSYANQLNVPALPSSIPSEQPAMNPGSNIGVTPAALGLSFLSQSDSEHLSLYWMNKVRQGLKEIQAGLEKQKSVRLGVEGCQPGYCLRAIQLTRRAKKQMLFTVKDHRGECESGVIVGHIMYKKHYPPALKRYSQEAVEAVNEQAIILSILFLDNQKGYNDSMSGRFLMQSQNMDLNVTGHLNGPFQNHLIGTSQQTQPPGTENMLALRPQQSSMSNFLTPGTTNLTSDDYFTEEDIRLRSHEMLENEDMQHLLRIFNMGGHSHTSANVMEENYPCASAYMPNMSSTFGFDDDRSRSSGKAVVGWLKLKAALRWGIFIRKKAAERRAQIVELDDL